MNPIPFKSTYVRRRAEMRGSNIRAGSIYKVRKWREAGVFEITLETGQNWLCSIEYWEDYSFEVNLKNILSE